MSLPNDAKARKNLPLFTGVWAYFPDALIEVARVSKVGNDQHNPGQPLHWDRSKSTDQMDSAARHMLDHKTQGPRDTDNTYHLAKAMWRLGAELQLTIEAERERENGVQASAKPADVPNMIIGDDDEPDTRAPRVNPHIGKSSYSTTYRTGHDVFHPYFDKAMTSLDDTDGHAIARDATELGG